MNSVSSSNKRKVMIDVSKSNSDDDSDNSNKSDNNNIINTNDSSDSDSDSDNDSSHNHSHYSINKSKNGSDTSHDSHDSRDSDSHNNDSSDDEECEVYEHKNPTKVLKPSKAQEKILQSFREKKNIKIRAVAGAGKTQTLLFCAGLDPSLSVLDLTYNKTLQLEIHEKITNLDLQRAQVKTYHSAIGIAYDTIVNDDAKLIKVLKNEPECLKELKADVLMLDEAQDMTIPFYLFIEKYTRTFPFTQIVIVGDPAQNINTYMKARVEFLTKCEELPAFQTCLPYATAVNNDSTNSADGNILKFQNREWVSHSLDVSYRLTPANANFLNRHLFGIVNVGVASAAIVGGNTKDPNIKPRYLSVPFDKMPLHLGYTILKAIKKYGCENVAVIIPSVRSIQKPGSVHPMAVVIREYLSEINLFMPKDDQTVNEKLMKNKLVISSWNSFKGLERDVVISVGLDESYFQYYHKNDNINDNNKAQVYAIPNIMVVAGTRARKYWVIVADPGKTLRTVNLKYLHEDADCSVDNIGIDYSTFKVNSKSKFKGKINVTWSDWLDEVDRVNRQKSNKSSKFSKLQTNRTNPINLLIKPGSIFKPKNFDDSSDSSDHSNGNNKTKLIIVSDLLRFIDSETMHKLNSLIKVLPTKSYAIDDNSNLSCDVSHTPLTIEFKGKNGDSYSESVAFLYNLVIPALVELKKTGKSKFAKNATMPKIVTKMSDIEPFSYSITKSAYDSFPETFWSSIKKASKMKADERSLEEWFQLAVSEILFHENSFHTARQIINYDWIDKKFVNKVTKNLLSVLKHTEGKFQVKLRKKVIASSIEIIGVADYIDFVHSDSKSKTDNSEIWLFKCASANVHNMHNINSVNNEHLLSLASYMAIGNKLRGHLYSMQSNQVTSIELSLENRKQFIDLLMSKFEKKVLGNLLTDIEKFKMETLSE